MIKKSKKLIWAIACFLFIGCACTSADQLTSVAMAETENCGLDLAIVASDDANLRPGDVLKLRANKISADLEYMWSTVPARFTENFFEKQVNKISFTVPEFDGLLKINLQAEISGVCVERDDFEIELATAANTELVDENTAVKLQATHTPTVTASPTPSPEPTMIPTVAPSLTPEPTATATNTPQPTSPPLPTSTPLTAPVITRLEIISTDTLVIEWTWGGTLQADQHFAVRLWRVDNPDPTAHNSLTWIKETSYQLKINNADFPAGEYILNVAVVEGPSFDHHETVVQTENQRINLPNIEPPAPPPCPPVCTDP